MKSIKYVFLIVIFFIGILIGNIINTFAKTDVDYYEEVFPIRNKSGNIIGEEIVITIPKDYNKEIIKINSSVFDAFYHFSSDDKEFVIKYTINNKSKYNYEYINNSFVIAPKNTFNRNNYSNSVRSDSIIINDSYYRSYNSAIKKLVSDDVELSDENLDLYLRNNGYDGINELNKYYDDFYGKFYSFSLLLDGNVSNYKETNSVLVEDAYKYFYSHKLMFSCGKEKFGILKYENNCNNVFNKFNRNKKTTISTMKIYLDRDSYFSSYLISVDFKFELFKSLEKK